MNRPAASLLPVRWRPGIACWGCAAMGAASITGGALALALPPARDADERLIVQIADARADRREAATASTLAALRGSRAVQSARRLGEAEVARLIAPYLGGVDAAGLPLPALIEARLSTGADTGLLRRRLQALGASVTGPGTAPPQARAVAAARRIAWGAGIAGAGAVALVALLAVRRALAAQGSTIAILRELGAEEGRIARTLAGPVARDAAAGIALGFAVALAVVAASLGVGLNQAGWLALLAATLFALAQATTWAAMRVSLGRAA